MKNLKKYLTKKSNKKKNTFFASKVEIKKFISLQTRSTQ